jgi:hypothetical protein
MRIGGLERPAGIDAGSAATFNALASVFPVARKAEITPKFQSDAGE